VDPSLALLTEIAQNTKQTPSWVIPLIVALSTLGGGVLAAVLTFKLGDRRINSDMRMKKMEINMEIVSRERIKWLERLRSLTAIYWHKNDILMALITHIGAGHEASAHHDKMMSLMDRTSLLGYKIRLLLNDAKTDQRQMKEGIVFTRDLLDEAVNLIDIKEPDFEAIVGRHRETRMVFMSAMQKVAAETWRQTKEVG
jgi:hypothetical protein